MSSAGRKKDNLEPFSISESAEFSVSKTYNGLEQDGVRIFVDQTVGNVTTINVYTTGNTSTRDQLVDTFTISGVTTRILLVEAMSSIRIEVTSDFASTLSLVVKPSSSEALIDQVAKQLEIDTFENNENIRHDEIKCMLEDILEEIKKTNTYIAMTLGIRE